MSTKTQQEWFEFYKTNPIGLEYPSLFQHASNNDELNIFVKCLILTMLRHIHNSNDELLMEYESRQYDIAMTQFLRGNNVKDIIPELPVLQIKTDKVKETVWGADRGQQINALADLVMQCYVMAEILDQDLDAIIFQKMGEASREIREMY